MTFAELRKRPALEGAAVQGGTIIVPGDTPAGHSPLERLLARGRVRATLAMLGPAFVAAIAYVDPGNFATNVSGGAQFGYLLLWVVLAANGMAMLIQYRSAKLGIVTFGVPLVTAGLLTGVVAFAILELQTRGFRRFELAITALLGIIFLGFLYETLRIGPSVHGSLSGLVPHFAGSESILLAVGIIGATVMPHAIYLHSALTQGRMPVRDGRERARVLRFERLDIVIALGVAGLINLSMLAVAAKLFHSTGHTGVNSIEGAYHGFGNLVGGGAALAFAVALLASGASSSSVGTYAGQVVMRGFVRINIPIVLRRLVTMAPAIALLAIGFSPTRALVLSQVVLSFGIPFALIPLVLITRDRAVMGEHVNGWHTTVAAGVIAAIITSLNLFLIYQQFFA